MYSEANMPTLSHFFCKWWIILINENYKSAIELNYWTLNHSVTNSVFQWHFLDLKKTSFPHLKNIVCFGRDVSKCAFERKFTTQPQIIPSKTQNAIFKNGSIFTIEYLKISFLPDFTLHMFGTIKKGELEEWNSSIYILEKHIHLPQFVSVH